MNDKRQVEQPGGVALDDIYFVLFRHKWKILLLTAVGMAAAAAFHFLKPPLYSSEAEIYIRYVLEGRSFGPSGADGKMKSPDERGDTIINSEVEIIQSLDLAQRVVTNVGAEKILAKAGGGKDLNRAAALVKKSLLVEVGKKSSVIHIIFQHPDPEIVQPVLKAVVENYSKRHIEVHQGGALDDFISNQTDELHSQIKTTEGELASARSKAGVISIEDSKKLDAEEVSKISLSLLDLETELAERQAALNLFNKTLPASKVETNDTVALPPPAPVISSTIKAEYDSASKRLTGLWTRNEELRKSYTEESKLVKENREQISEAAKAKERLEKENPGLLATAAAAIKSAGPYASQTVDTATEAAIEQARVVALQTKIGFLRTQLTNVQTEQTKIAAVEPLIEELQTRKQLQETNYHYFARSKEQARIDGELGTGKVTNISTVEEPTPPFQDASKENKIAAMISVSGLAAGLALAFLIELVLDRSVKRPKEIETKMGLRLFLSVPDISRNGHRKLALASANGRLTLKSPEDLAAGENGSGVPQLGGLMDVAPWDHSNALHPFYEALRDRLVGYFEVRNLTHKPKLVAVTGANGGSGATTMAVGLAASLSETGDGNVLLVDMNLEHGAAHQFYKGKPGSGLEDALEQKTRDGAMVQDNLYVVNGSNGDKLPRILPKRFANLLPKLKASDYDYIIFDMPPITQTSVTLRLAGFMDMVLLVLESEKTDRGVVQRANALLAESKANVSVVLNKTHNYVPALLHQEF